MSAQFEELEKLLTKLTDEQFIPAISMAIGHQGNLVFLISFGQIYELQMDISTDTMFDIASMTKVFTGIAFMRHVECV